MNTATTQKCPKCGTSDFFTKPDVAPETHGSTLVIDRVKVIDIAVCAYCLAELEPKIPIVGGFSFTPSEEDQEKAKQLHDDGAKQLQMENRDEAIVLLEASAALCNPYAIQDFLNYAIENDYRLDDAMYLFKKNHLRLKKFENWLWNECLEELVISYGVAMLIQGEKPETVRGFWIENVSRYGFVALLINYLSEAILDMPEEYYVWQDYEDEIQEMLENKNAKVVELFTKIREFRINKSKE